MKKQLHFLSAILLAATFGFVSCSKTGDQGPIGNTGATGPAGPLLTGSITGNVLLYNIYGAAITNDYKGGYILLKNSTTNATVDSVIADSTGKYTIPSVQSGSYTMLCQYNGYGLNEHENLEFNGGTLLVDNKLAAIPTFTVSTAIDTIRHKNRMNYLYGTLMADPAGARTLLVFIGNTPYTSSLPATYSFTDNVVIPADSGNFLITTPLNTFYANGFASGNTVYLSVYGAANDYTYGDYMDYPSGKTVYTAIAAAPYNIVSVTLP